MKKTDWIPEAAKRDSQFANLANYWKQSASPTGIGKRHANVIGPVDTHAALMVAALAMTEPEGGLPFVILPDELQMRRLLPVFEAFWPGEVELYPQREFQLASVDASSQEQTHRRITVLTKLLRGEGPLEGRESPKGEGPLAGEKHLEGQEKQKGRKPLVLVSPAALLQPLLPPEEFQQLILELKLGQVLEPQVLASKLAGMGYESTSLAESAGEFSLRGDIVDVIPIDKPMPTGVPEAERAALYGIRVSFFDDEIDQIRFFDPMTQRQVEACTEIHIPPAQEILIRDERRLALAEEIEAWGENRAKEVLAKGASREHALKVKQFCTHDAEKVASGLDRGIVDRWYPLICPEKASLLDYFRLAGARPVLFDTLRISQRMDGFQADFYQQASHLLERGQTTSLVTEIFWTGAQILKQLDQDFPTLTFALIHQPGNGFPGALRFDFQSRESEAWRGREEQFQAMLRERRDKGLLTYAYVADKGRRERLHTELLQHAPGALSAIIADDLAQGFEWPQAGLLVLGSQDLFGTERRRKRKRSAHAGAAIDFFTDLSPGEMVVHEAHGIGIYEGLENIETEGSRRDYIKIRYSGEDTLYLPIDQLDQIRKYVGTDGRTPKLSRLGSSEWTRLKDKARDSIRQLATNLVKLYAKRSKLKGHAFPEDTVWDQEFAESFPYEETEDQLRCIDEIKKDMESPRVMDRLLCGDVGYGKTEVAFRAMFKAVNGGMQAALLAPTTVLTQQHYDNFIERIGKFPVRVGLLSRFASEAMQKKTLRGLATGEIDVVIGTHRLLSKDVKFKRLGLLVVDEEQRFGVDHKEMLKELYPTVDVLTLSATPIPRTLHMSMSGIRDISMIEEPPQDRREVQTFVMEFDEAVLTDAITREVSRDGQVFYLFNNVKKIYQQANAIEDAIPGCRVAVAHGQMNERELEDVIAAFVRGEADVLVCTTIIESGIDMPNVNTLIVTNADRLGLSQIYQLKGRVGRSGRQAYAYITYEKNKVLKENAQKRLAAIREYTELGSGFKIALRDLEVRGAGNLLGAEQHGHMEAIGYELYVRMLDEEVKNILQEQQEEELDFTKLQQAPLATAIQGTSAKDQAATIGTQYLPPDAVETQIDLPLDAYLPASLIPDEGQRMDMYRRLGDISNLADYYDILDELTDRYGDVPPETYTLADISYVRSRAGLLGISVIRIDKKNIILQFKTGARPNMQELAVLLSLPEYRGKINFNAGVKAHLQWVNQAEPIALVPEKLRRLFSAVEKEQSDSQKSTSEKSTSEKSTSAPAAV